MKYGRFEKEGKTFYGAVEGDQVTELEGSIFDGEHRTNRRHALSALKTLVPCMPYNFYCAGLNYVAHIEWGNQRKGTNVKPPEKADIGFRSPAALIATDETIVIPADSPGPVQYEGELVAVIGKTARNLSEADALSCVLGYTLGNDLSERTWQKTDRTLWRAKNCDTWKPMGPFITTGLDPMKLTVSIKVNGETVSEYDAVHDAPSGRRALARHRRPDHPGPQARRRRRDHPEGHRSAPQPDRPRQCLNNAIRES
jgi:2-keto-4-pentenoate hydratase/2-oxohepta-3-ene-1,7-dioic acid hydratase in catechol pathway